MVKDVHSECKGGTGRPKKMRYDVLKINMQITMVYVERMHKQKKSEGMVSRVADSKQTGEKANQKKGKK